MAPTGLTIGVEPFIRSILQAAKRNHERRSAKPLPASALEQIAVYGLQKHLDTAVMSIFMYAALLRLSEVIVLRWDDLSESGEFIAVSVRKAKNDQLGEGRITYIAFPHQSKSTQLWNKWKQLNSSQFVFPSKTSPGHISKASAARKIKSMLREIGLPDYSSHSFRAGAATSAAADGVDLAKLQRRGRWRTATGMASYVADSVAAQGGCTAIP